MPGSEESPRAEPAALAVALKAARVGGQILRRGLGKLHQIDHKGLVDLVTERDRQSEAAILGTIRAAFPDHAILAEESGWSGELPEHCWIVDPLDGTTNYAHGYPVFCVSIAYQFRGELDVGVILDVLRQETFTAQRGRGAALNGRLLRVSSTADLIDSVLATGFPYARERLGLALAQFNQLAYRTQGLRRAGAAALDLAYVAAGRLDGYWEATLAPWDCAAGILIVREAGGTVTRLDGTPGESLSTEIVSSNGLIHPALLAALAEVQAPGQPDERSSQDGVC